MAERRSAYRGYRQGRWAGRALSTGCGALLLATAALVGLLTALVRR